VRSKEVRELDAASCCTWHGQAECSNQEQFTMRRTLLLVALLPFAVQADDPGEAELTELFSTRAPRVTAPVTLAGFAEDCSDLVDEDRYRAKSTMQWIHNRMYEWTDLLGKQGRSDPVHVSSWSAVSTPCRRIRTDER
jgi:hypothetical protein